MSNKSFTTPSAEGLATVARMAKERGLPPVHEWTPQVSGDLDMRIARDGTWFYQGGPISRPQMVRLFSTILRREDDAFFLVTPVEKWRITVEDAPFIAVDVEAEGTGPDQRLTFQTNVGDTVTAGAEAPIRVDRDGPEAAPAPYVTVRDGLEARIDRKSFYRLVDLGTHHDGWFGLWSDGTFFRIAPSEEMSI